MASLLLCLKVNAKSENNRMVSVKKASVRSDLSKL